MDVNCIPMTKNGFGDILMHCPIDIDPVGIAWDWWWKVGNTAVLVVILLVVAFFVLLLFARIANQWDRAVILRLGKFQRVAGPGLFFKWPFVERIADWVSVQVEVTQIKAEQSLTKDTVPVNVKTVMFWRVLDPRAAVVDVADYQASLSLAAQTALREAIGGHDFTDLLSERESVDAAIKRSIEDKAKAWGLEVQSIEIQDVQIPEDLQRAMSQEAQAEREQHARTILATSEVTIAEQFVKAAKVYENDPVALQLRAMNIIYETTKDRGSTILLPTSMLDAMSSAIKGIKVP